ncbi:MAG: winged helix-turn-helix domain-containing protein [Actinomycetota bacterium]
MAGVRERLEAAITGPLLTPEDAERAARAAEALAAYIRAANAAEWALVGRSSPTGSAGLKHLKLEDAAEQVLEEEGRPLHVRDLGKRIKDGGWEHPRSTNPRADQINYQLAARLPRDRAGRFRRVAPNTFGLVRWESEARSRPKPKLGTFRSRKGPFAREIDERSTETAVSPWR